MRNQHLMRVRLSPLMVTRELSQEFWLMRPITPPLCLLRTQLKSSRISTKQARFLDKVWAQRVRISHQQQISMPDLTGTRSMWLPLMMLKLPLNSRNWPIAEVQLRFQRKMSSTVRSYHQLREEAVLSCFKTKKMQAVGFKRIRVCLALHKVLLMHSKEFHPLWSRLLAQAQRH